MTQIAQKIDFENRELVKRNVQLGIQVKSQENDREILLQQLLFEKQDGKKLAMKLKKLQENADELEKQGEVVDQSQVEQKEEKEEEGEEGV